ncbi:MAG TPA: hypothetical protein VGQ51_18100 [Puia sp.]|jgi:hypothetical protein|nr:hypothetical protein [Puia sp.]
MKQSPAISILLLVFLCLLGLLVFSATIFGQARSVDRDTTAALLSATVYPEPVGGTMNVRIDGTHANEDLLFQLVRVNGDVIYSRNIHAVGATTVKTLRRPMVDPGYYVFRVVRQRNGEVAQGRITFK